MYYGGVVVYIRFGLSNQLQFEMREPREILYQVRNRFEIYSVAVNMCNERTPYVFVCIYIYDCTVKRVADCEPVMD